AALCERDGLVYANDGDWVESLTALQETASGELQLIDHSGRVLAAIAARMPALARVA
ncbi:MAG TPA: UDP-2,3-diacylglucosamine diphosphatase, partial [Stenotrophomonas sp.]|nr:UDP-2,3-diacylglucosamine diphosphatase [Stenotrophomonas sp.]